MKSKASITIKRAKNDTYTVIISKDGARNSYPSDSPQLEEYKELIQWQLKMMKEMNAGSVKLSVS